MGPDVSFANPVFLYGLLAVPLLAFWYLRRHRRLAGALSYSSLKAFAGVPVTLRKRTFP